MRRKAEPLNSRRSNKERERVPGIEYIRVSVSVSEKDRRKG